MPILDFDSEANQPQSGLGLPWAINPAASWLDYNCWVECALDAGMALHKPLPQRSGPVDTLATKFFEDMAPPANPDAKPAPSGGVNVGASQPTFDVIQRMATSTYRFALRGYGWRVGYQIPIPGLISVGGVPATPEGVQTAFNRIVGNMMGAPIWYALWDIRYMLPRCPSVGSVAPIPVNMGARIRGDIALPSVILVPFAPTDENATTIRRLTR